MEARQNNFTEWSNTELIQWISDYEEISFLRSRLNLPLYHQAIEELHKREPNDEHYTRKHTYYTENPKSDYHDYVSWVVAKPKVCDCNGCRVCKCR